MKKEYDFSRGKRGAVAPHSGKTRITIWLDNSTLEWFRKRARQKELGYQTVINMALKDYILDLQHPVARFQDEIHDAIRERVDKAVIERLGKGITKAG